MSSRSAAAAIPVLTTYLGLMPLATAGGRRFQVNTTALDEHGFVVVRHVFYRL